MIQMLNTDCMDWMADKPDKYYDLAIVDPPYGLDKDSMNGRGKMKDRAILMDTSWDNAPKQEYFDELFRVSKNQAIWGGNYFTLPATRGIICWDKVQPWENFSAIEYCWTSFNVPARLFRFDNRTGGKVHPTQKPVKLYEWLLMNYAKQGDKILDTHGGSGSICIACHNLGFDLDWMEIDKDYYEAAVKRYNIHIAQQRLF